VTAAAWIEAVATVVNLVIALIMLMEQRKQDRE
jgi:hypothetical protein